MIYTLYCRGRFSAAVQTSNGHHGTKIEVLCYNISGLVGGEKISAWTPPPPNKTKNKQNNTMSWYYMNIYWYFRNSMHTQTHKTYPAEKHEIWGKQAVSLRWEYL